jgi:hypothetical protein
VDAHFHLLDNLLLYHRVKRGERSAKDDEGKPLSSFVWNEIIFRSFQAGHLKKLEWEFYHTLKSAVAKRIYRFLDKRFHFSNERRYSLAQFAREHVGLSRKYDAAQLKRRLKPAIKELEETGYLKPLPAAERFARIRRGEWEVLFVRAAKPLRKKAGLRQPVGLEAQLIDRGVTASSAARLVCDYPAESIVAKLEVFDQLAGRRDARISENAAGFLVKSIQDDYLPPAGFLPKTRPSLSGVSIGGQRETGSRLRKETPKSCPSESEKSVDRFLALLLADERCRLVQFAVASARGIPAQGLRRSVASGNEAVAEQYRQLIVRQHVEHLLGQEAVS